MTRSSKSKTSSKTPRAKIKFRERRFCDINLRNLEHPAPDKNYKATLPGPPGWQYKIDPGK